MAHISAFNAAAFVFSLIAFIQCLLILCSGLRSNVLLDNYFITADISQLNVPSKLSNSTALIDLSQFARVDYVGSEVTASSLGLATRYTVSLFTTCGQDDDGSSVCTDPKVGYSFDPAKDLKLDGTAAQGSQSPGYAGELQTYSRISYFLAVAYVIAALCSGLSCIATVVSVCLRVAAVGAQGASFIAALFLLAASIASVVTFNNVKDTFNSTFGNSGLNAAIGSSVYIISFIAFAMATLATVSLGYHNKAAKKGQQFAPLAFNEGGSMANGTASAGPGPGPGFIARVKTWGQHQYQKHPAIAHRNMSSDDDRRGLVASVEDDFSHHYPEDIAMGPMHDPKGRVVKTAYESYRPGP